MDVRSWDPGDLRPCLRDGRTMTPPVMTTERHGTIMIYVEAGPTTISRVVADTVTQQATTMSMSLVPSMGDW